MTPGKIKLLGIVGLIVIFFCCFLFKADAIEKDISSRTLAGLYSEFHQTNALQIDKITVSGRDVTLNGVVPSEQIRESAGKIAENIYGVNAVYNNLVVKILQTKFSPKAEVKSKEIQKELNKAIAIKNIEFKTNSSILKKGSFIILNKVLAILKEYPSSVVAIEGFTDSRGNVEHNKELSQKRADAVKNYLVKNGISKSRLSAHGFGIANPIADNNTPEGRRKNRRVEFKLQKEK